MREQCWLNETLTSCRWIPEGLDIHDTTDDLEDVKVTEDDLQAVLKGARCPPPPSGRLC